jgi:putative ABC transport system permease protein
VGLGLLGSLALSRTISRLLFDVGATDPVTYGAAGAALLALALLASVLPAWRASRVAPATALRTE